MHFHNSHLRLSEVQRVKGKKLVIALSRKSCVVHKKGRPQAASFYNSLS
nr:MAG TPA: hypothetical protein [Caudoviricetes sp.]